MTSSLQQLRSRIRCAYTCASCCNAHFIAAVETSPDAVAKFDFAFVISMSEQRHSTLQQSTAACAPLPPHGRQHGVLPRRYESPRDATHIAPAHGSDGPCGASRGPVAGPNVSHAWSSSRTCLTWACARRCRAPQGAMLGDLPAPKARTVCLYTACLCQGPANRCVHPSALHQSRVCNRTLLSRIERARACCIFTALALALQACRYGGSRRLHNVGAV